MARNALRRLALTAFFFAAWAVLMTWPLLPRIDDSVIGWVGDNFYFTWLVEWFRHALVVELRSPLFVPHLNYPEGWYLAYNEVSSGMVLLGLPVAFAGGATLAYNFILLASFVLSGVGMYLWCYRLTGHLPASLLAGFLFAFAPYRLTHLLGHLNLMGTQWLPFYFLGLDRLMAARRAEWRTALLPALALGLTALASLYYMAMTALLTVAYGAGYLLWKNRRAVWQATWWAGWMRLGLISLPLLLPAVWPSLALRWAGALPPHDMAGVRTGSASPTDFLIPSVNHFLWGDWLRSQVVRANWVEATLYLGAITLLFAGISWAVRGRVRAGRGTVFLLLGMAAVAFVLALGTNLHWFDAEVAIPWPGSTGPVTVWLPGAWLYERFPFYANMRVWMRYGIFVSLFLTVLAGIGLAWWLSRIPTRRMWGVAGLVLVVALLDFYPGPYGLSTVKSRPVDLWLAQQPGEGAVAEFPLEKLGLPQHVYYTTAHGKPYIGAFYGAYTTPQYRRIYPDLAQFPEPASLAVLRTLGVEWLLVSARHNDAFTQQRARLEEQGLIVVYDADDQVVLVWPEAKP